MKAVSYEEFDYELYCITNRDYRFDDKMDFFGLYYQNQLSLKENIKLFLKWVEED